MAKKPAQGNLKQYRNVGVTTLEIEGERFLPGSEFEAILEPEYEQQMLVGGHLVIIRDSSPAADRAAAEAAEGAPIVLEEKDDDKATNPRKKR